MGWPSCCCSRSNRCFSSLERISAGACVAMRASARVRGMHGRMPVRVFRLGGPMRTKKMTEISEIKDAEKSMFRPNYGRFLFLRPYYIISINDKNVRNEHALKILNGFFLCGVDANAFRNHCVPSFVFIILLK